jgi:hypothetical protein
MKRREMLIEDRDFGEKEKEEGAPSAFLSKNRGTSDGTVVPPLRTSKGR